jgi:hypothetical protein
MTSACIKCGKESKPGQKYCSAECAPFGDLARQEDIKPTCPTCSQVLPDYFVKARRKKRQEAFKKRMATLKKLGKTLGRRRKCDPQEIWRLYDLGFSYREVAKKLGVSSSAIYYYVRLRD